MKELAIYVSFLKKYILVFLFFSVLGVFGSLFFIKEQPTTYAAEALYELKYSPLTIEQSKLQTDEIVAVLRYTNFRQSKEFSNVQTLEVYKPGPVSLHVRLISSTEAETSKNMTTIDNYLFSHSSIQKLSMNEYVIHDVRRQWSVLFGIASGFVIALFTSLVIEYMRIY